MTNKLVINRVTTLAITLMEVMEVIPLVAVAVEDLVLFVKYVENLDILHQHAIFVMIRTINSSKSI